MSQDSVTSCYHCGDPCSEVKIEVDSKSFCCEGCKLVFEILQQGELCQYYDLEQSPGVKIKSSSNTKRFAFLDDAEVLSKLICFKDDSQTVVQFHLPQIHCSSCLWLLENLFKLSTGIISSQVNFVQKQVTIHFQEHLISLRQLVELLTSIGYEPSLNLQNLEGKHSHTVNRKLYYQLGVAGFTFGNIMLLSFPEYLGINTSSDWTHSLFFGYLSLALALPVFIFSANDYFRSAWLGLRKGFLNIDLPISLGILVLFTWSCFEIISGTGSGYMDSLSGLVFFLLIGKWYQSKTYEQLSFERDYTSYFPISVTKIENQEEVSMPLTKLKAGDVVLVRNQELIPADGILTHGDGYIDYGFVTGESEPVSVLAGQQVYAGGRQVGSAVKLTLTKQVSQSYLTGLWSKDTFDNNQEELLENTVNKVSAYFTPIILTIAVLTFIYWSTTDLATAFQAAAAVLIVACPCALALASPFTFGNTMRLLGRLNLYLKKATLLETLAQCSTIVFDKTGTITSAKETAITFVGKSLNSEQLSIIKSITKNSLHPLSLKITASISQPSNLSVTNFREIEGAGIEAIYEGKIVRIGSSKFVNAAAASNSNLTTHSWVSIDGEVLGAYQFNNQYRLGLAELILKLKQSGYKLAVISGDNESEREPLTALFGNDVEIKFNQSPLRKLNYIKDLQDQGDKVVMIGDGLNDAGALKQSDIGITVSEDINNFSPACDVIMDAAGFTLIPELLKFSRLSLSVVKWAFAISFAYNIVGLFFATQGLLSPLIAAVLMPISSLTVVVFSTLFTWLYAQKLVKSKLTQVDSISTNSQTTKNEQSLSGRVA